MKLFHFTRLHATIFFLVLGSLVVSLRSNVTADTVDNFVQMYISPSKDSEAQTELLRAALDQFRQQKFDAALEQLDQAHKKYSNLPPGRISIALFFLDVGQTKQTRQQLELAAIQHPDSPWTFDAFGRLALVEGRITDAAVHLDQTLRLIAETNWSKPEKNRLVHQCELGLATVAEQRGQWPLAQQYLQRVLDRDQDNSTTRRRLAQAMFHSDEPDSAYSELIKATETDPSLEPAETTMARLYVGQSNLIKAEFWFDKATEEHPDNVLVFVTFGSWLLERGRNEEAADQARKGSKIAPESSTVKALLGVLAMTVGKHAHAERYFQQLHSDEPGNFDYGNRLALSLIEQSDEDKQQRALQLAEVNARQYPRKERALATLGWVYHLLGRTEDARKLLQKAISSGRASADTIYFYARAVDDQDQTDKIRTLLEKAVHSGGLFLYRNDAKEWLKEIQ